MLRYKIFQQDQFGVQSTELLKLRGALEEKLKQKRGLNSFQFDVIILFIWMDFWIILCI